MRNEPRWLTAAEIVTLNRLIVADTNEPFAVRDLAALESAAAKPAFTWFYEGVDDRLSLAATLMFAIARNHPFVQGNKRTGFESFLVFLELAGVDFRCADDEALAELIVDVITGRVGQSRFEAAVRPCLRPSP